MTSEDGMEFTCARDQSSQSTPISQSIIVTKLYKETLHSDDKTEAGLPNNWHPAKFDMFSYNKKTIFIF